MEERNLVTVEDGANYDIDDYESTFAIQEDIDEEIYFQAFESVFKKIKSFRSDIDIYLNRYQGMLKEYLIYYFTVRDDLKTEQSNIEQAISEIEDQISDLKYNYEINEKEIDAAEEKFDEIVADIEEITGTGGGLVVSRTNSFLSVDKEWDVDYKNISDDDIDDIRAKVDDKLFELETFKSEYWVAREEKYDAENLLEKANENLDKAKEWDDKLGEYSYD